MKGDQPKRDQSQGRKSEGGTLDAVRGNAPVGLPSDRTPKRDRLPLKCIYGCGMAECPHPRVVKTFCEYDEGRILDSMDDWELAA